MLLLRNLKCNVCRSLNGVHFCVLGFSLAFFCAQLHAQSQGRIYWTEQIQGKVQRSNLDGTNIEDIITGLTFPRGVARDVTTNKIYWSEDLPSDIERANLDGSSREVLIHSQFIQNLHIALDVPHNKIYWSDVYNVNILRANLADGSGIQLLHKGVGFGIAVDNIHNKLYWTDILASIRRSNLDGTAVETLIQGPPTFDPRGIALDIESGKMFWADIFHDVIFKANLDGSSAEILIDGLGNPADVALDSIEAKIYWTDTEAHKIQRANLDGSAIEDVITEGTIGVPGFDPRAIAVINPDVLVSPAFTVPVLSVLAEIVLAISLLVASIGVIRARSSG